MRLLVLIALCFAVASASYANRNRFNRMLRNMQQQEGKGYESQDLYNQQDDDQDDDQCQDDDEDQYPGQQCPRTQRCGGLNLQDDDQESECGNSDQDDEDQQQDQDDECGQIQNRNQRQRCQQQQQRRQQQSGPQQQQKRQQQRKHQCTPKYQLLQELEQPNCKLASKLYKQAKEQNDDKNTVVSPAAVQLALAAIQRGARGNTKRQIQRLIGSRLSQQQQQQAHAALQQVLQGKNQQQQNQQNQQNKLKTTTTIVVSQKCQPQQKFIQAVKACLNAQVKKCNFQRQPQQCRQQINQYVAQKTNQKLRQVVPQDAITSNTKMIVVNTAQLKARWGQQFRQQQQTKQGKFYPLGCQQPKPVQVLQSQGQFSYYEDQQLKVVGIPTQRQELTLYVIVPKDKDGLNEIEKQQIQNGQQLKELLEQADQQQQQIDVELPKFQIKHKIDAKQTLKKQGCQDLCDADEADLSGICGQQGKQGRRRQQQQMDDSDEEEQQQGQYEQDDQQQQQLHLNKLIHQATIKVDEQGISAARTRGQQQQNQQDQDEDEYQQQDDEDDEDQQEQYEQQQLSRQEMYENIFGQRQGRQGRRQQRGQQGGRKVKVNRAFAFAVKHNPSNQIVLVGRVVDATQKPNGQQQGRQQGQSLNGVDQQ